MARLLKRARRDDANSSMISELGKKVSVDEVLVGFVELCVVVFVECIVV